MPLIVGFGFLRRTERIKMYIYETHCHTNLVSACSDFTPEQIVELYVKNGYAGLFVTDHFLNGNTTVDRSLPYEEQIDAFCRGYEAVKKAAGDKLQVFFGFEYSYKGTDFLIYGWDKEDLKKQKIILDLSLKQLSVYCRERGVLAVHAHPFREAGYIDHIRLYPEVEGVEVYNACRNELCNSLGEYYAKAYSKPVTAGTDIHHFNQKYLGGMAFENELTSVNDFIAAVREGSGKIVKLENKLV